MKKKKEKKNLINICMIIKKNTYYYYSVKFSGKNKTKNKLTQPDKEL